MSRIDDAKQRYPELNISIIDLFSRLDNSGNNKYLDMICKVVSNVLEIKQHVHYQEIQNTLKELGFNTKGMSIKEHAALSAMINAVGTDLIKDFKKFMNYNERGLIINKDLNSYVAISQVKKSIEEADEKALLKELEKTTHVVHNDENWLVVRPLSFAASAKYGANTKWCTTFNDRTYFLKYWKRGILAYFINKKTNVKWAVFKSLDNSNSELSWWNVTDKKTEFFDIEFDDYMLPIIKQLLKSPQTNEGLCSYDVRALVERECLKKEEPWKQGWTSTTFDLEVDWNALGRTTNISSSGAGVSSGTATVTNTPGTSVNTITTNPCNEISLPEVQRGETIEIYNPYLAGADPASQDITVETLINDLAEKAAKNKWREERQLGKAKVSKRDERIQRLIDKYESGGLLT